MIGFLNAWQLSGHRHWLEQSLVSWQFVKNHIRDQAHGEWYWGVTEDHTPMPGQDKAGFWKYPYHNSRACIEIIQRIGSQL
jgi:mannobiose 2-epimerase